MESADDRIAERVIATTEEQPELQVSLEEARRLAFCGKDGTIYRALRGDVGQVSREMRRLVIEERCWTHGREATKDNPVAVSAEEFLAKTGLEWRHSRAARQ